MEKFLSVSGQIFVLVAIALFCAMLFTGGLHAMGFLTLPSEWADDNGDFFLFYLGWIFVCAPWLIIGGVLIGIENSMEDRPDVSVPNVD